jgi:hypothetical protein
MSDFINQSKTYKQDRKTQYCFRPMSSRRVHSVKELNRLTKRMAELEADHNFWRDRYSDLLNKNDELEEENEMLKRALSLLDFDEELNDE